MALYRIDELLAAAKAIVRGSVPGVGTEAGSDLDLTIHAAAHLLQGAQVAGAHITEQLDPQTADAERRDQLVDMLGLRFAREATPARGLIAITLDPALAVGGWSVLAGAEITFPAALFADGLERTYRLLSTGTAGGFQTPDAQLRTGSGLRKLIPEGDLASLLHEHTLLVVKSDLGVRSQFAVVRSSNADQTLDLLNPLTGLLTPASANRIYQYRDECVAVAECLTPGKAGNAPAVRFDDVGGTIATTAPVAHGLCVALLLEMSGGGDEVGEIDGDSARVVRLIEDTLAMPPAYGNAQHWRELALSCPDVDLDDALVYQHVRGPGTIDIVCIGRSGSVRSTAFPDVNLSFCAWGNNQRRIGDVQAARVRAWCRSQAAYFDDIEVRSVEWDFRGNTYAANDFNAFLQSTGGVVLSIEAQDGYGPDCGVALDVTPYTRHPSRLYTTGSVVPLDPSVHAGQRVWVTVGPMTADVRQSFATIVTTILSVSGDRLFAEIADVSALGPSSAAMDGTVLKIHRWGSAGPLTQPCVDTVFAHFDELGPGTYIEPPRSSMYVQYFSSAVSPVALGHAVMRWPPEGRRWSGSLRSSELRARLLTIAGVRDVTLSPVGNLSGLLDFDPAVFQTLACTGVVPRSA